MGFWDGKAQGKGTTSTVYELQTRAKWAEIEERKGSEGRFLFLMNNVTRGQVTEDFKRVKAAAVEAAILKAAVVFASV